MATKQVFLVCAAAALLAAALLFLTTNQDKAQGGNDEGNKKQEQEDQMLGEKSQERQLGSTSIGDEEKKQETEHEEFVDQVVSTQTKDRSLIDQLEEEKEEIENETQEEARLPAEEMVQQLEALDDDQRITASEEKKQEDYMPLKTHQNPDPNMSSNKRRKNKKNNTNASAGPDEKNVTPTDVAAILKAKMIPKKKNTHKPQGVAALAVKEIKKSQLQGSGKKNKKSDAK
jgi:hypothetical protein